MLIAVNGWFWGQLNTGSGQYVTALARHLPQLSSTARFVLVLPGGAVGPVTEPPAGWEIVAVPVSLRLGRNLGKVWFEQYGFPRLCRRLGADVALVPYWAAPLWRPCPVAVTVHDLIPLLLPAYRGGTANRLYTGLVSWSARRAHAVLTDSQASRRDIVARLRISAERVQAVHLAVGAEYRRIDDPGDLERVRAKYSLPGKSFLLYLGGFDTRKNLGRTFEAYARLAGKLGEAAPVLVVGGKLPGARDALTPDPRALAKTAGVEGRVHFAGWVDETDKPALYSLAQAALFVSEYEGFGLPVLEAQACGCPVITSR